MRNLNVKSLAIAAVGMVLAFGISQAQAAPVNVGGVRSGREQLLVTDMVAQWACARHAAWVNQAEIVAGMKKR